MIRRHNQTEGEKYKSKSLTWTTLAPACRNCNADAALSMPPVASIGNPGRALATAETARKAIGLMALPDTPPYVVRFSLPTAGHAVPSPFKCIRPDTVFVAVQPSAPPKIRHMGCSKWQERMQQKTINFNVNRDRKVNQLIKMLREHLIKIPSFAAPAIVTMFVTFGVSLAKNGILTAALTHLQILRTSSGS